MNLTFHNTAGITMSILFDRDMIDNYAFRSNYDQIQIQEQDIIKHERNKSQIPYECKVGNQVSSETPGMHLKFSTPCTGLYPVSNVYKNVKIRIQRNYMRNMEYP
jgi:hypothetical protein